MLQVLRDVGCDGREANDEAGSVGRRRLHDLRIKLSRTGTRLDLDMPGMTGTDVQRRLTESDMRVPVIIIAGRDDRETEARCRAAGAAAYLPKPIDERILLDTLAIVVRKD